MKNTNALLRQLATTRVQISSLSSGINLRYLVACLDKTCTLDCIYSFYYCNLMYFFEFREAGMCAMRESTDCTTILMRHVKKALECTLKGKLYSGSDTKSSIRQIQEQSTVGWWRPGTITRKDLARFEKFEQRKS